MAKKEKKKKNKDNSDEPGSGPEKKGGKQKLIVIVVSLMVTLGGVGGGLFYFGFLDSLLGIEYDGELADDERMNDGDEPIDLGEPVYYDIPEFVADLKTNGFRAPLLKLSLVIQIDKDDQAVLVEREPKIIDRVLQYLRDQERQNLVGEAGAEMLRAEIVLIIDATIKPAKVQNVLFKSMILQ